MIRHIVMWKLAAEDAEGRDRAAAEITEALEGLVGVVPTIRSFTVSRNGEDVEGNSDLVLDSLFDDRAGLDEYIAHPAHQDVVAIVRARVNGRAAIDVHVL